MSKRALSDQTTRPLVTTVDMVLERGAAGVPLGPLERQVVAHVDGKATIGEIAQRSGLSVSEAASLAARLLDLGAVVLEKKTGDAVDEGWDAEDDFRARRTPFRSPY